MRERLEQEFAARMPWANALDNSERECLLAILRKMVAADAATAAHAEPWRVTADEPAMTGGDAATN